MIPSCLKLARKERDVYTKNDLWDENGTKYTDQLKTYFKCQKVEKIHDSNGSCQ